MDVHGTTSNTSAAGLQVLRSSLGCRDLSNKGTNDKHGIMLVVFPCPFVQASL